MLLNKFSNFYQRFEKYISAVGLIYGFIFTSLTLTQVDAWLENFWIIVHLLIAAFGITVLTLYENKAEQKKLPLEDRQKFHFYLTLIIQFAFGGLFSTFFIFYIRSSSIFQSWLFLLMLAILLVGNELWKKHYARLAFQISVFFIAVYLFFIFLLPVLFHRLGDDLFIVSGILAVIIVVFFLYILKKFALEKFKQNHSILRVNVATIFIVMNILYFTNIIPPIPLSLNTSGVFHSIVRTNNGNYQIIAEPKPWWNLFILYTPFHARAGETIYVFSSIVSPIKFDTEIIHRWQHYNEKQKEWIDSARIAMPVIGGREGGYRTYSFKKHTLNGRWRVKVETPSGQVIGRINFEVKTPSVEPLVLKQITL